jgi:hypothetical protein
MQDFVPSSEPHAAVAPTAAAIAMKARRVMADIVSDPPKFFRRSARLEFYAVENNLTYSYIGIYIQTHGKSCYHVGCF